MNKDLREKRIEFRISQVAFDRRQSNDYGEVWTIDKAEAENAIAEAREYVDKIEQYLSLADKTTE